jgi:hypothetical protein
MTSLGDHLIVVEIDLLVFDRPPQPLDKDVIKDAATAIHADPNIVFLKPPGKLIAGKLTPLINVEDLGCGYLEGFLQG